MKEQRGRLNPVKSMDYCEVEHLYPAPNVSAKSCGSTTARRLCIALDSSFWRRASRMAGPAMPLTVENGRNLPWMAPTHLHSFESEAV